MTKSELLRIAKPILFNTDMVRAILDDRKTATRRAVKGAITLSPESEHKVCFFPYKVRKDRGRVIRSIQYFTLESFTEREAPFHKGDILYVRESGIIQSMKNFDKRVKIYFPADDSLVEFKVTPDEYERLSKFPENKKISPYWLTKQESRIFLKVTDVRVERLQDMETIDDRNYISEGAKDKHDFIHIWDATVKDKEKYEKYGWYANPWVWVIEFERIRENGRD
ncbi:MAG: hypothetical protein HDR24_13110 [Lachnospiraceae bacterium]|nr:hypothetical protein [Lachnospiraceae bacterium]